MPNTLHVNGRPLVLEPGTTAAAALAIAKVPAARLSVAGQPRGPLCGMGICFECRATIDGEAHRLSCQAVCANGMAIDTEPEPEAQARALIRPSLALRAQRQAEHAFDVLVVGGGPAGLLAAGNAAG